MNDPNTVTVVLASGNRGKLMELREMLSPLGYILRPQAEWDVPEVVEDGPGFVENALIKARHASAHTGLPAIADDSGLVVPAIGGAPGIFSARYAGPSADDEANNRKLLETLAGIESHERMAFFHCSMVMVQAHDDPVPLIASANWHGEIAFNPRGANGFGYDPLFQLPATGCTSAELSPGEKNRISHRGRAARFLIAMLESGNAER